MYVRMYIRISCRDQRYTKLADWEYVKECSDIAKPLPLFGGGDVLSHEDYYLRLGEYFNTFVLYY